MAESQKRLTVFTPTYNRAYTLHKCYESLKRQTNNNFLWLIVDDGSTDNTEELIAVWKHEKNIQIEYIKQANVGKQRAHNTGVGACKTELFICVDSDDYLTDDAVEKLLNTWDSITNKENLSGIIALKGSENGLSIVTVLPKRIKVCPLTDLYELYGFEGDTALMYKTEILKKFPFVLVEGEKFIGEEYIYRQIDQHYSMFLLNEVIYIYEYLTDGYTKNMFNLIIKNPKGYILLKKQAARLSKSYKYKFKHTICYIAGCFIAGEKNIIKNAPYKILGIIAWLPAVILYNLRYK